MLQLALSSFRKSIICILHFHAFSGTEVLNSNFDLSFNRIFSPPVQITQVSHTFSDVRHFDKRIVRCLRHEYSILAFLLNRDYNQVLRVQSSKGPKTGRFVRKVSRYGCQYPCPELWMSVDEREIVRDRWKIDHFRLLKAESASLRFYFLRRVLYRRFQSNKVL